MNYDCTACPSFCCSYPIIPVTRKDLARLAKAKNITVEQARKKYTCPEGKSGMRLRHKSDARFKATVCTFLDPRTRLCTVYHDRPAICDNHPGDDCEWFDRMNLESYKRGRTVVRISVAPWTVDADHVDYDSDRRSKLIRAYAQTNGVIPD